ncbi:hypothetical protein FJZ31_20475 [Candidatus Poribacteria bacterium]|nr:hypothetical protein [Candidatus Poribacteria bacterium]
MENMWIVFIVAIVIGFGTLAKVASSISNAISQRKSGRRDLQEMRDAIARLQTDIDEIKATLADIVISLHDRV